MTRRDHEIHKQHENSLASVKSGIVPELLDLRGIVR